MPSSHEIVHALAERMRLYREIGQKGDEYLPAHLDDVLLWAEKNLSDYELGRMARLVGAV